jgi:DNA repair ATPase RecN
MKIGDPKMYKEQCQDIMSATCYVLDSNAGLEERLKEAGIDQKDLNKIKKALDLINEVNHKYSIRLKRLNK